MSEYEQLPFESNAEALSIEEHQALIAIWRTMLIDEEDSMTFNHVYSAAPPISTGEEPTTTYYRLIQTPRDGSGKRVFQLSDTKEDIIVWDPSFDLSGESYIRRAEHFLKHTPDWQNGINEATCEDLHDLRELLLVTKALHSFADELDTEEPT